MKINSLLNAKMSPGNKRDFLMCFREGEVFLRIVARASLYILQLALWQIVSLSSGIINLFYYHLKNKQTMILLCLTQVVHFNFLGMYY